MKLILGENMYSKIFIATLASLTMVACTINNEGPKVETKSNTPMDKVTANGATVYKASCTKCHSTTVHTRPKRTIKSLDSLKKRVAKCNINVGTNLTDKEVEAISAYLNTTYYKF